MAGNSVRSDVLPALEAGSYAALIPYHLVWARDLYQIPARSLAARAWDGAFGVDDLPFVAAHNPTAVG